MRLTQYILRNFFFRIKEASDKEFQRNVWLSQSNPLRLESSFTDLYNDFESDLNVEDILDRPTSETGLSEATKEEVRKLKKLIVEFDGPNRSDKEILENPAWDTVVIQAKSVLHVHCNYISFQPVSFNSVDQLLIRTEEMFYDQSQGKAADYCEWVVDISIELAQRIYCNPELYNFHFQVCNVLDVFLKHNITYQGVTGHPLPPGDFDFSSLGFEKLSKSDRNSFTLDKKILHEILVAAKDVDAKSNLYPFSDK